MDGTMMGSWPFIVPRPLAWSFFVLAGAGLIVATYWIIQTVRMIDPLADEMFTRRGWPPAPPR